MSDRRQDEGSTTPERMGIDPTAPGQGRRRVDAADLPDPSEKERNAHDGDLVRTQGGDIRTQRSTEEHGGGPREVPGVNAGHQRLGGPGPDYAESHSEPTAHPGRHPGGDTESAHAASEGYGATRDHDAIHAAEAGHALGHTDYSGHGSAVHGTGRGAAAEAHAPGHAVDDPAGHAEGHGEPRLGPIDLAAWGASLAGVLVGGGIAFLFYLATT